MNYAEFFDEREAPPIVLRNYATGEVFWRQMSHLGVKERLKGVPFNVLSSEARERLLSQIFTELGTPS